MGRPRWQAEVNLDRSREFPRNCDRCGHRYMHRASIAASGIASAGSSETATEAAYDAAEDASERRDFPIRFDPLVGCLCPQCNRFSRKSVKLKFPKGIKVWFADHGDFRHGFEFLRDAAIHLVAIPGALAIPAGLTAVCFWGMSRLLDHHMWIAGIVGFVGAVLGLGTLAGVIVAPFYLLKDFGLAIYNCMPGRLKQPQIRADDFSKQEVEQILLEAYRRSGNVLSENRFDKSFQKLVRHAIKQKQHGKPALADLEDDDEDEPEDWE